MWPCVAATAVEMAQGPAVPLLMGRPDRINETDPIDQFSNECFDPEQQINFWGAALPIQAVQLCSLMYSLSGQRIFLSNP